MKHVFLISNNEALEGVLESALDDTSIERIGDWSSARDALVKQRFDLVCIDYDQFKVEGLDAFILIDNILQKEHTPGCLLMSESSERARQFIDGLSTVEEAIVFGTDTPDEAILRQRLTPLLEGSDEVEPEPQEGADKLEIDVELPPLSKGKLQKGASVARVLYALSQRRPTGVLEMHTGGMDRRFPIVEGELLLNSSSQFSKRKTLLSVFAWSSGSYSFERRDNVGRGKTLDLHKVIQRGVQKHLSQSDVMRAFMQDMKAYPIRTNLWLQRRGDFENTTLGRFLRECDGETTFEQALGTFGANAANGFKAAFYAYATDLIYLSDEPRSNTVVVHYDRDVEEAQRAKSEADKRSTKAYRATGTGRIDLEEELSEYLEELERATPYEIFDVWEGCGRKPVQRKFYQMVKVHHPDVYGGNVSGEIKRLAQEIFITIKDAYKELLKVEREQTQPKPESWDEDSEAKQVDADEPVEDMETSTLGERSSSVVVDPDTSADRLRQARAERPTPGGSDDAARQTKIERLKAKRRSTPIGMGREPSSPVEQREKRKKTDPEERKRKMEEIRRRTSTGKSKRSTSNTGNVDISGDKPQDYFNRGYKAYRNEKWDQALKSFGKAYDKEPNNGLYMTFYAHALFMTDSEQMASAERLLRKAIETGHKQAMPDAHLFLGQILKVKEQPQRAAKHFKRALKLNPGSRAAQRELRLYEMRNRDKKKEEDGDFLKNLFKK